MDLDLHYISICVCVHNIMFLYFMYYTKSQVLYVPACDCVFCIHMFIICTVCLSTYTLTKTCIHAHVLCVCVCGDLHHPWLCQLSHLSLVSRCFGPNPSCWPASPQRRSNTVFPLNQMKKVKRRTQLHEPEGSARTPRTSHFFLQFNTTKVPPLCKKLLPHHHSTITSSQKQNGCKEFRITTTPL